MAPFYAYAIQLGNDASALQLTYYRSVITFASRDVADEWWRAIKDGNAKASGTAVFAGIKRVTPQLYTSLSIDQQLYTSIDRSDYAKDFKNRVFFSAMPNRDNVSPVPIPGDSATDHTNGGTFFIRLKREPAIYWYASGTSGATKIQASGSGRTTFKISIKKDNDRDKIMIGSDDIYISLAFPGKDCSCRESTCCCNSNRFVYVSSDSQLVLSKTSYTFKFKDLKDAFETQAITQHDSSASANDIVKTDDGEAWELV